MTPNLEDGVSVVVPVYNSADGLPALLERLGAVRSAGCPIREIILVNDGSRDGSWREIAELAAHDDRNMVRGFNLMRNYGQHNALLCGIRAARYGITVTIDDDLQNPPEEIPRLLSKLQEGFDVVYGTPAMEQHGLFRNLASRFTKIALQNAMGAETARSVSAFRAFRTQCRAAFDTYRGPYVSIDVLLTWGASRFTSIPVRQDPRLIGASNYTLFKLATHALNMITGFTTLPLRIASLVGFAFTLFGIIVLGFVLFRYVIDGDVLPGFPFLASVIAIFSGAQLFALGIMGEYLARIHFRMMDRPSYAVASTTDHN
jgi:undecaprenyl-phosphate 4-deoxy-4-formamido-L-arabinose transferase